MKRVLSDREEMVVNRLRESGCTINDVANLFGVSRDVVVNANPKRRAYITGYNAAVAMMKRKFTS